MQNVLLNIHLVFHNTKTYILSKHSSWRRRTGDVFSVTIFLCSKTSSRQLQDIFLKTSWRRRLANTSCKRLEDVLKTFSEGVLQIRLEGILKTSSRRLGRQKIIMLKMSSRRLGKQEMFAGSTWTYLEITKFIYFLNLCLKSCNVYRPEAVAWRYSIK